MANIFYIDLYVDGQKVINKSSDYLFVAGTINLYGIRVKFSSLWSDVAEKYIQLSKDGVTTANVLLDEFGQALIPAVFTANAGEIKVNVYGGDKITTTSASIKVTHSDYDGATHITPEAPPLEYDYMQTPSGTGNISRLKLIDGVIYNWNGTLWDEIAVSDSISKPVKEAQAAAETAAQTATTKATEATNSATTANNARIQAQNYSSTAYQYASDAESSKFIATTAKDVAVSAKTTAEAAKTAAETAKTAAQTAAQTATDKANEAAANALLMHSSNVKCNEIALSGNIIGTSTEVVGTKVLVSNNTLYIASDALYNYRRIFVPKQGKSVTFYFPNTYAVVVCGIDDSVIYYSGVGAFTSVVIDSTIDVCVYVTYTASTSSGYTYFTDDINNKVPVVDIPYFKYNLNGISGNGLTFGKNAISPYALGNMKPYGNLMSTAPEVTGYVVTVVGGSLKFTKNATYNYRKIAIEKNCTYYFSSIIRVIIVDNNDNVLQPEISSGSSAAITHEDATYAYVSYRTDTPLQYFSKGEVIRNLYYNDVMSINLDATLSIPKSFKYPLNKDLIMYKSSLLPYDFDLHTYSTVHAAKTYSKYLKLTTSETAKSGTINIVTTSKQSSTFTVDNISVQSVAPSAKTQTVLFIGDSFIYNTFGVPTTIVSDFVSYCNAAYGSSITTIGTVTNSAGIYSEGHSGWKLSSFVNTDTVSGVTNPFRYNGAFDFPHYMSANGYSTVDSVFIHLGVNDLRALYFPVSDYDINLLKGHMTTMVNSILAFNANAKIYVCLLCPGNSSADVFSDEKTSPYIYNVNRNILNAAYMSLPNIFTIPTCAVIDPDTMINDSIHPTAAGYTAFAQCIADFYSVN